MRIFLTGFITLLIAAVGIAACGDDETDNGSGGSTASSASSSSAGGGEEGGSGGEGQGGEPAAGGGGAGQGGSEGGAGGGGVGGGSGYDGVACFMCINMLWSGNGACVDEYTACDMNGFCQLWAECVEDDCWQPGSQGGCWDVCDAENPDAAALTADLYACTCGGGGCADVCGSACN